MEVRDSLLRLEHEFWAAAGDGQFYERRFAEDGLLIVPGVTEVMDKAATTAAVAQSSPWTSYELHDVRCAELASDVAALAYRAAASREGERYEAMITSVYVRQNGDWQLALHQQTPIAG